MPGTSQSVDEHSEEEGLEVEKLGTNNNGMCLPVGEVVSCLGVICCVDCDHDDDPHTLHCCGASNRVTMNVLGSFFVVVLRLAWCYNPHDFGTSNGLLRCLISRGGKIWTLICLLAFYCGVGGVLFLLVEPDSFDNSWLTAAYFTVVTVCTIGYGDYYVKTTLGRVLLFFYAHIGIVIAGVTANSISHAVISAMKIPHKREGLPAGLKLRVFLEKHPVILFLILYLSVLFLGSMVLTFTVDITPDDIANAAPYDPVVSNRTIWGWDKAFYFSWMTLTTTGYGDQVQESYLGRLFTCIYGVLGFSFLGIIFHKSTKFMNGYLPMLESNSRYTEVERMEISYEAKKSLMAMLKLMDKISDPVEREVVLMTLRAKQNAKQDESSVL